MTIKLPERIGFEWLWAVFRGNKGVQMGLEKSIVQ